MSNVRNKIDQLNEKLVRRSERSAIATAGKATEQKQELENCQRLFDEVVTPILTAAKKDIEDGGHKAVLDLTQGQEKTMPSARFAFKPESLFAMENFLVFTCDGKKINAEFDVKISGHSHFGTTKKDGLENQEAIQSALEEYIDLVVKNA